MVLNKNNFKKNNSLRLCLRIKSLLGLLVFISFSTFSHSQEDSLDIKNKIIVKWTASALMNFHTALQFSGEFFYRDRSSIQLEYGYIFPLSSKRPDQRGHNIRIEHRFYNQKERWYLAPELNFTYRKYTTKERFSDNWQMDSISGNKYTYDTYFETVGVRKAIGTINLKAGFQHIFKKPRIVLDLYVGLGVRFVNTKFTSYPTVGEYVPPIDNWLEPPFEEGSRVIPNGIAGIKLGYQIR